MKKVLVGAALILLLIGVIVGLPRFRPPAGAAADTIGRKRILRFWELYRQATAHRVAGRTREAAADYARALELNRRHEDVLYYLGNMHFELGEYGAAEQVWRRLVQVNPASARAHSRLGDLYMCTDLEEFLDLDAARAEFDRAHQINREDAGPPLKLGQIALLRDDLDTALGYLDAVIGSNYTSVDAHYLRSYIAWKRGDERQAEESLAQAVLYARPTELPAGTSQEGDTQTGSTPLVQTGVRCAEVLHAADLAAGPAGAGGAWLPSARSIASRDPTETTVLGGVAVSQIVPTPTPSQRGGRARRG
ncbi:MAG: tetratricopeptide repeat protein [Gemmatimonadales bacterium]